MTKWAAIGAIGALGMALQTPAQRHDVDRIAIFPIERAATLAQQCSRRQVPGPVGGTWLPDSATIANVEAALVPAFEGASNTEALPKASRHPFNEYYRQYGGLIVGERRAIYVNAFHQSYLDLPAKLRPPRPPEDWQHVAVNVCDGGWAYFGATYDMRSGKIDGLTFNSPR